MNDIMSKSLGEKPINYDTIYYDDNLYIDIPYNYIKPKNCPQGYMKVYIKNHMSRISFFGPNYVYAENGNYKLSNDEINLLINALNKPYEWNNKITNFKAAIIIMNYCHNNDENRTPDQIWKNIPEDLPMPDYTKLS